MKLPSTPTLFILFGGTGDLNARKLAPALYNLFLDGYLPDQFAILGTGRTPLSDGAFAERLREGVNRFSRSGQAAEETWDLFAGHIRYQASDVADPATYQQFGALIKHYQQTWNSAVNVIYYLAVSPTFFPVIAENMANAGLAADVERVRIVVEKPFGHDLQSAKELNALLGRIFDERQIYRIDHYLGKETVQNIMAFRFANSILEPLWNRDYIEHVQISVTEQLGVGERGPFYEGAGALRDMIQNHLLQLLCLVAMEPPVSFGADEVRDRKVDVLKAMRRFSAGAISESAVRGQYGKGWIGDKAVAAYRDEPRVNPESTTETFAAVRFFVDNWRWKGVPFYLRTGKRMAQSASVISIQFKEVPHGVYPSGTGEEVPKNRLIISIQPEMSIRLQVQAKRPGQDRILDTVDMVFDYKGSYTNPAPEAYETLLLDTLLGDQTLFMRADQVEAAWALVMPIIQAWSTEPEAHFPNYAAGSNGPESAEAFIERDGFAWFSPAGRTPKEPEPMAEMALK